MLFELYRSWQKKKNFTEKNEIKNTESKSSSAKPKLEEGLIPIQLCWKLLDLLLPEGDESAT